MMSTKNHSGSLEEKVFTEDEELLWEIVTRNVIPLHSKKNTKKKENTLNPKKHMPVQKTEPALKKHIKKKVFETAYTLSAYHERQILLRKERLRIIDLHGQTPEQAEISLFTFVKNCHQTGQRYLLMITGKGRGVLRKTVQHWLQEGPCQCYVLSYTSAKPEHGGEGAFYVVLRKNST